MKQYIITIIACLLLLPLSSSAMHKPALPHQRTSQDEFELRYSRLPSDLQRFVDDFSTWSPQNRAAIKILGLSFVISKLSADRQAAYSGNVGLWIDTRTHTQLQRENFIYCLMHLQNTR